MYNYNKSYGFLMEGTDYVAPVFNSWEPLLFQKWWAPLPISSPTCLWGWHTLMHTIRKLEVRTKENQHVPFLRLRNPKFNDFGVNWLMNIFCLNCGGKGINYEKNNHWFLLFRLSSCGLYCHSQWSSCKQVRKAASCEWGGKTWYDIYACRFG